MIRTGEIAELYRRREKKRRRKTLVDFARGRPPARIGREGNHLKTFGGGHAGGGGEVLFMRVERGNREIACEHKKGGGEEDHSSRLM